MFDKKELIEKLESLYSNNRLTDNSSYLASIETAIKTINSKDKVWFDSDSATNGNVEFKVSSDSDIDSFFSPSVLEEDTVIYFDELHDEERAMLRDLFQITAIDIFSHSLSTWEIIEREALNKYNLQSMFDKEHNDEVNYKLLFLFLERRNSEEITLLGNMTGIDTAECSVFDTRGDLLNSGDYVLITSLYKQLIGMYE